MEIRKSLRKKNVVFHNFAQSAKIVSEFINKAIDGLKVVMEDFGKTEGFKTVSPVVNKKKNEAKHKHVKGKVKGLVRNVQHAVKKNAKAISKTIDEIKKTVKNTDGFEKKILSKKGPHEKQKKDLDSLDDEKKAIEDLIGPLTEIFESLLGKEQILKSFRHRLK